MSPGTRTLSRAGTLTRGIATVAVLVVLGVGQWRDTNDLFPFGSLSQYATARSMDGTVRSVFLQADTVDTAGPDNTAGPDDPGSTNPEDRITVPLDQQVVGVGRAEVEGQLALIVEDPSLLQGLAESYSELHPDRPPLRRLYLMRSQRQLQDGIAVGTATVEELVTWTVQDVDEP